MIHLLLAIHNHQPVGNFDFIFARAFDRAYRPFLEVLKAHPRIHISLHFSGILLDWLEKNRPEYIRDVRTLCDRGQLEILGGGYYEPILPMLSDSDKEAQITKLNQRILTLFGFTPKGMWLTERVWEPALVGPIARSGIEYVLLDGSHFKMVGKTDAELEGFFETEDGGNSLKLFPIHDVIRDMIPFRDVGEVVEHLRKMNTSDHVQVVFGDDGEKFGDWPHTFDTVYTHGWLDRFFKAIENEPDIFTVEPLQEGLKTGKNLGLIYLPPASYQEMMVWAQNPTDVPRFRSTRQWMQDSGRSEDAERFLRGTFWRNFLTKYPESNRMHKQGVRLSKLLENHSEAFPTEKIEEIRDHILQSQCNCAYWHGVFGGLYLPHLRFGLYRHLIGAQSLLDATMLGKPGFTWEESDWNFDGRNEGLFNSPNFLLGFTADGSVDQFWLKRTAINLCDTLTRRREPYHEFVLTGPQGGTKLENQISSKEEGLAAQIVYDQRIRTGFSEWLLPIDTPFDAYRKQDFVCTYSLHFGLPQFEKVKHGWEIRFLASSPESPQLQVAKTYSVSKAEKMISIRWEFKNSGIKNSETLRFRFVVESLFCLLAGNAHDRYTSWIQDGGPRHDILAGRGEMLGVSGISLIDEWLRLRIQVEAPGCSRLWRDAIETVSQSEGGYERVYQGTVIAPSWDVVLTEGATAEFRLNVDIAEEG